MMLEKIKQLEAVDYYPEASEVMRPSRKVWSKVEAEIHERYSPSELSAIRRNGFTGVSMEERCHQTGNTAVNNTVYRNFSRNVHSTDYAEQFGGELIKPDYLDIRNALMLRVTHNSVRWVVEWINNLMGGIVTSGLNEVKLESVRRV